MSYVPVATEVTQPVDTVDRSTAAAEFRTLKTYIAAQVALALTNANMPGEVRVFSGKLTSLPAGWLIVPQVATAISRSGYPNLHAIMQAAGYPYGAGDGSTTFGMPYIPVGYTILPAALDADVGTQTVGEVIAHVHTTPRIAFLNSGISPGGNDTTSTPGIGPNTGSTGGTANKAAGIYMHYIIKY